MERIPEPELMSDEEQAKAYASADFSEPHNHFIQTLTHKINLEKHFSGNVIDLGCGPCDISIRFAKRYHSCQITAVDGSSAMLDEADKAIAQTNLTDRIQIIKSLLPDPNLNTKYDLLISNSLLHHLHQPEVLWSTIQQCSHSLSQIFIMDLLRPENEQQATKFVELYAANEPEILQRDFFNSLKAAFTVNEVKQQLAATRLSSLQVEQISDRHFCVYGTAR